MNIAKSEVAYFVGGCGKGASFAPAALAMKTGNLLHHEETFLGV